MKKIEVFIIFFIGLFLVLSCNKDDSLQNISLNKDNIDAEKVWNYVMRQNHYKKYPRWSNHKGLQPGQSPHGRFNKVYINRVLSDSLPISDKIAPDGSIIVKENYTTDKVLAAYTIMIKVKGYFTQSNDWFWAKYDASGNIEAAGKLMKCVNCHSAFKDNDYIILHKLNED